MLNIKIVPNQPLKPNAVVVWREVVKKWFRVFKRISSYSIAKLMVVLRFNLDRTIGLGITV
jgi:hypothetical protein